MILATSQSYTNQLPLSIAFHSPIHTATFGAISERVKMFLLALEIGLFESILLILQKVFPAEMLH